MKRKDGITAETLKECGKWAEFNDLTMVIDTMGTIAVAKDNSAYVGTRAEFAKRFGNVTIDYLIGKIGRQGVRFCYKCGEPIRETYESDLYCEKCHDEEVAKDTEKLRNFHRSDEGDGVGYYALLSAIVRSATEDYVRVVRLIYDDPLEESLRIRAKELEKDLTEGAIKQGRKEARRKWLMDVARELKEIMNELEGEEDTTKSGSGKQRKGKAVRKGSGETVPGSGIQGSEKDTAVLGEE